MKENDLGGLEQTRVFAPLCHHAPDSENLRGCYRRKAIPADETGRKREGAVFGLPNFK
jgi:hypothetical protein